MKDNEFSNAVKIALINRGKTQKWLIEQVRERTGRYMDTGYMWRVLHGKRHPPEIIHAIKDILDV